jgi:hypothetical protein
MDPFHHAQDLDLAVRIARRGLEQSTAYYIELFLALHQAARWGELVEALKEDPLVGEFAAPKLTYYATTTREDYPHRGRITDLIESGEKIDVT